MSTIPWKVASITPGGLTECHPRLRVSKSPITVIIEVISKQHKSTHLHYQLIYFVSKNISRHGAVERLR